MTHAIRNGRPPPLYGLLGLAASLYAWAVVASTFGHPGTIGPDYNAPGTDYMVFHAAVGLALRGDLSTLYNPDAITALLNRLFDAHLSAKLEFRPWLYPPSFILLLLPFSPFGFAASYWLFQTITGSAMLIALRSLLGMRPKWLAFAAVACPAASICFISGQCSFLIVALLATGVALLDRRPGLAGVAFGLLSFKPQFFLLVPVVLVARMSWRPAAAAAATSLAMVVVSLLWFGPSIWTEWFSAIASSTSDVDPRWFLLGRLWGVSVYTCAYLLGAPPGMASVTQTAAIILAGCCVWCAFRKPLAAAPRTGVMLAAALLAAPHAGGYDLLLLVAASGLFISHLGQSARNSDWLLFLVLWSAPLLGLPVLSLAGRFVPVLTVALLMRILSHAGAMPRMVLQPGLHVTSRQAEEL